MRGYYQHAALVAECLMNQVEKNEAGFYSFPRFFRGSKAASGTEVDGTSSIVIGMVLLWERLPEGNPTRNHIREFLFQDASPINYFKYLLQSKPLIAGTGEFGCGMKIPGECYNVVQNDLAMLALLSAADMATQFGSADIAANYRALATKLWDGMEKYLVDQGWFVDLVYRCQNSETESRCTQRRSQPRIWWRQWRRVDVCGRSRSSAGVVALEKCEPQRKDT